MKNKIIMLIIPLLVFFIGSFNVYAAPLKVSITCKDATIGSNTTCVVSATSTQNISAIHAEYSISGGASFSSFSAGNGWQGSAYNGAIDLYTDNNKSNTFQIGTFTLKANKVGTATLTIKNLEGGDANFEGVGVSATTSKNFTIKDKTSTTTTKKTTASTQKQDINSTNPTTTQTTTQPRLTLTSVKVDDFEVTYENGIYYATVTSITDSVNVSATAPAGITILGTGKRTLTTGKNSVELVLRDMQNNTTTYQLVITRPELTGDFDTSLSMLKVVDYKLNFNPDILEYTINVPYNASEVYVIAEAYNKDVIINGDGLITLSNARDTIYVKVSYGNLSSTEYVIHIKKDYTMMILIASIGTLGLTFFGYIVYSIVARKKVIKDKEGIKNAQEASEVILAKNVSPVRNVQINGESVVGIGKAPVIPTPVAQVQNINNDPATANITSLNEPQIVSTAPAPQIKVVKRVEPTVNVVNTNPINQVYSQESTSSQTE